MEARLYRVGESVNEYYAFLRDGNAISRCSLVTSQRQYMICFPFFVTLKYEFVRVLTASVDNVFHLGQVHLNIQVSRCLLRVAACGWRTFV